jgi:ribosomal protein S27E
MNDPNPYSSPQTYDKPPVLPPNAPQGSKQFAPCFQCGQTLVMPVGFTWWGGVLGPKMFSHVKCASCGTVYNGKTGKSNATAIAIYIGVSLVTAMIVAFALSLAR